MRARTRELVGLALALGIVVVLALLWNGLHRRAKDPSSPLPADQGIGKVTAETPKIIGAFEQAMIEHTIRSHQNDVKHCYEVGLAETPALSGRVVIQITVTSSGQVAASIVQSSTLNQPAVEQCIATAARQWKFPRPSSSGTVVISCPFTLTPEAND